MIVPQAQDQGGPQLCLSWPRMLLRENEAQEPLGETWHGGGVSHLWTLVLSPENGAT